MISGELLDDRLRFVATHLADICLERASQVTLIIRIRICTSSLNGIHCRASTGGEDSIV